MSGTLKGKYPEEDFYFTTTEGESFSLTGHEVADLVAFVRKMKVKEDELKVKRRNQTICPECGGDWDGLVYTNNPPKSRCMSCRIWWTP